MIDNAITIKYSMRFNLLSRFALKLPSNEPMAAILTAIPNHIVPNCGPK